MMALTATATAETQNVVCRILGMQDPLVIAEVPNRANIKYAVVPKAGTLEEAFAPLWFKRFAIAVSKWIEPLCFAKHMMTVV